MNVNSFCGRPLPAILLILLAGIIVYANTFHVPFILDDDLSIPENPVIRSLDNYFVHSAGYEQYPRRVIGYLTFALNYRFGGLDVTGYHVVNLGIHLAAALLVYVLLRLTFRTPYFLEGDSGPKSQVPGFTPHGFIPLFAALLFAVHPIQTQAVTYIVQRLSSLATLFYLMAIVLYVWGRLVLEASEDEATARRFKSGLLIGGSVLAAVLAMKTKEIAFTLPLAVVLFELSFFYGNWKRRLLYLAPILATWPIIPLAVLSAGESSGDFLTDIGEQSRESGMSRSHYLFTQFRVIVTYLRLLILPINQNLDYHYPIFTTFFTPTVFLSFLLLASLFALALCLWLSSRLEPRASRLISFGILWFFLTLTVESSVIPITDVIFEHRLYLPSFGASVAFASVLFLLVNRIPRRRELCLTAVSALIVLALGFATVQRNDLWGDELRLWADTAAKSPNKGRPLNNLAVALEDAGQRAEAAETLSRAIEVEPTYYRYYYNLADLYLVSGYPEEALPLLQESLRLKKDFTKGYVKLAAALLRGRRFHEVTVFLEENLDRVARQAEARFYLGAAYAFLGNREAALRELEIVSSLDSGLASDLEGLLRWNRPHVSYGPE